MKLSLIPARPSALFTLFLSVVFFLTNGAFLYSAEANLWQERQAARLAWLNTGPLPVLPTTFSAKSAVLPEKTDVRLPALSSTLLKVKETYFPVQHKNAPVILVVQDVHANPEAQRNIANAIQKVSRQTKGALYVGVEGVKGLFDFTRFRAFPDKSVTQKIAEHLLNSNRIAAPSYVGLTEKDPLPQFDGIDDPQLYEANVEAYRSAAAVAIRLKENWNKETSAIEKKKSATLNPSLKQLDTFQSAYAAGQFPLAAYLESISELAVAPASQEIEKFLAAATLERTLNFSRVESERKQVLEQLLPRLAKPEWQKFLAQSQAFRDGDLSHVDFYQELSRLLELHGLSKGPALKSYFQYVHLAENVDADRLLDEIEKREQSIRAPLLKNEAEKKILEESDRLVLEGKLINFALTPKEWMSYSSLVTRNSSLKQFEQFYELADRRSEKMVDNLLAGSHNSRWAMMIAGGFHTSLITEKLKNRGVGFAVLTPKLSQVNSATGTEYLSVFTQEKTPLEKMIQGQALFLADAGAQLGHPRASFIAKVGLLLLAAWHSGAAPAQAAVITEAKPQSKVVTLVPEQQTFELSTERATQENNLLSVPSLGTVKIQEKEKPNMAVAMIMMLATAILGMKRSSDDGNDSGDSSGNSSSDDEWKKYFEEKWGKPSDADLQLAQDYLQELSKLDFLMGQFFVSDKNKGNPETNWGARKGRTLRALFYLEPDVAAAILASFDTGHGSWRFFLQPLKPTAENPGLKMDMVTEIIARGVSIARQEKPIVISGKQIKVEYDLDGIGGLVANYLGHNERTVDKEVTKGILAALTDLDFLHLAQATIHIRIDRFVLNLIDQARWKRLDSLITDEKVREALLKRSETYQQAFDLRAREMEGPFSATEHEMENGLQAANHIVRNQIDFLKTRTSFTSLWEAGRMRDERARTFRSMVLDPRSAEIAGALLAGIAPEHVAAWREMLFEGDKPHIEEELILTAILHALPISQGTFIPNFIDGEYKVSFSVIGMIALIKSMPEDVQARLVNGVEEVFGHKNLTYLINEVEKPIGHIRYQDENGNGKRVGYLKVIQNIEPTLAELLAIEKESIVAMTTLPTSDLDIGPFRGIITFYDVEGGNHAMERAREWDAPYASMPKDMVKDLDGQLVAFEVVDANRVMIRQATIEETKKFEADKKKQKEEPEAKPFLPVEPETITLPKVDLSLRTNYLRTSHDSLSDPSKVGSKVANLNRVGKKWIEYKASRWNRLRAFIDHLRGRNNILDVNLEIAGGSSLPFGAFRSVLALNGEDTQFKELIASLKDSKSRDDSLEILKKIRELVQSLEFEYPDDGFWNRENLDRIFSPFWDQGVFVRDATNAQNLLGYPWFGAGLYLTEANVVGRAEFFRAIRDVWADVWNERAFGQRRRHKVDESTVNPAIWLSPSRQNLKFAFVVHTSDTLMEDRAHAQLYVVQGMGEAIVSDKEEYEGKSTHIKIEKATGKIVQVEPSDKKMMSILREDGGLDVQPVTEEFSTHSQFSGLVEQLAMVAEWVEKTTGIPQKIEGTLSQDPPTGKWTITLDQSDPFVRSQDVKKFRVDNNGSLAPGIVPAIWHGLIEFLQDRGWSGRSIAGWVGTWEELVVSGIWVNAGGALLAAIFGGRENSMLLASVVVGIIFVIVHTNGRLYHIRNGALTRVSAYQSHWDILGIIFLSFITRLVYGVVFSIVAPGLSNDLLVGVLATVPATLFHGWVYNAGLAYVQGWAVGIVSRSVQGSRDVDKIFDINLRHQERMQSKTLKQLGMEARALRAQMEGKDNPSDEHLAQAIALFSEVAARVTGAKRNISMTSLDNRWIHHMIKSYVGGPPRIDQIEAALLLLKDRTLIGKKPAEGKSLTIGLAAYLHVMMGHKVEVHDWHDTLVARNSQTLGVILTALEIKVGAVIGKEAYVYDKKSTAEYPHLQKERRSPELRMINMFRDCDIVFGSYQEMIFLWMRDWYGIYGTPVHATPRPDVVLLDEPDTPLVDHLHNPLIYSGPEKALSETEKEFLKTLELAALSFATSTGLKVRGKRFVNFNSEKFEHMVDRFAYLAPDVDRDRIWVQLKSTLNAQFLERKNKEYVVNAGRIEMLNPHTNAPEPQQRLSRGMHSALEIKENVPDVFGESDVSAVMLSHYFYNRIPFLSGVIGEMAGDGEHVINKMYDFEYIEQAPIHKNVRVDLPSRYFATEDAKWKAIVREVKAFHEAGLPILVNAKTIEEADIIARKIEKTGFLRESADLRLINVLDAKPNPAHWDHMGDPFAITVAAQVASRGHDVKLGEEVLKKQSVINADGRRRDEVGGLVVIGTHHSVSERAELQLLKRSGRRGENGVTIIFDHLWGNEFLEEYAEEELTKFMDQGFVTSQHEDSNVSPMEIILWTQESEELRDRITGLFAHAREVKTEQLLEQFENDTQRFGSMIEAHFQTVHDARERIKKFTVAQTRQEPEIYKFALPLSQKIEKFADRCFKAIRDSKDLNDDEKLDRVIAGYVGPVLEERKQIPLVKQERETLGNQLRRARVFFGVSRNHMAKFMNVTPDLVKDWENGRTTPNDGQWQMLLRYYKSEVGYTLWDQETNRPVIEKFFEVSTEDWPLEEYLLLALESATFPNALKILRAYFQFQTTEINKLINSRGYEYWRFGKTLPIEENFESMLDIFTGPGGLPRERLERILREKLEEMRANRNGETAQERKAAGFDELKKQATELLVIIEKMSFHQALYFLSSLHAESGVIKPRYVHRESLPRSFTSIEPLIARLSENHGYDKESLTELLQQKYEETTEERLEFKRKEVYAKVMQQRAAGIYFLTGDLGLWANLVLVAIIVVSVAVAIYRNRQAQKLQRFLRTLEVDELLANIGSRETSMGVRSFTFERANWVERPDRAVIVPRATNVPAIMAEIRAAVQQLPVNEQGQKPQVQILLTGMRENLSSPLMDALIKSDNLADQGVLLQSRLNSELRIQQALFETGPDKQVTFLLPEDTDISVEFLAQLEKLAKQDAYKNLLKICLLQQLLGGSPAVMGGVPDIIKMLKAQMQTLTNA